jgi:GAF domain-containing protein
MSPFEALDSGVWVLRGMSVAALAIAIASWLVIRRWTRAARQAELAEAARDASRRELERRNRELEALNQVAATIGRRADLPVAAGEILDAVLGLTGLPEGGVYRLDRAANTLALIAQRGYDADEMALLDGRPADSTMVGQAIAEGRLRVTWFEDSPPRDPRLRQMAERRGLRIQLTLPIAVKGTTWGALALCSAEPLHLVAEEVRLVEALTEQISVAVERAELVAEMREQTRRLETLALLAQTLTSTLSPRDVLDRVLEATRSVFGEAVVRVWLAEGDSLVVGAEAGMHAMDAPPALTRLTFGQGLAGHAALNRAAVVSERLLGDARAAGLDWVRAQGLVSGAAFPFIARGHLLGVLSVFTRAAHRFTPDEVSGLESFSHQAAIAIDNAALFAEAGQRAAEYRALFEVGQLVGATLDADRVLDRIVERCRALIGVDVAGIFRLERDHVLVFERGSGLSAEFVRDVRIRLGEGTTGRAVAERRPVWSADLLADAGISLTPANRALVARERYRAVLSLPILIKGVPYGRSRSPICRCPGSRAGTSRARSAPLPRRRRCSSSPDSASRCLRTSSARRASTPCCPSRSACRTWSARSPPSAAATQADRPAAGHGTMALLLRRRSA